jgi:hypothetical protein
MQYANALELYNNTNKHYPKKTTATALDGMSTELTAYMASLPKDPNNVSYMYISDSDGKGTHYCIGATIEGTPVPASACPKGNDGNLLVPGGNYWVGQ